MDIEELEIPVPWGFIAVKAWGSKSNIPVVMVHGQSDNAGSFDRLIPYLPQEFYYVCIDLPGHGKSSYFPPYLPIHTINNVLVMKLVVDYLDREKIIIIGHSWGGQISLIFTQLYPDNILKLVLLDTFSLYPVSAEYLKQFILERIDEAIKTNEKTSKSVQPSYPYEEALKRIQTKRMYGDINEEAAINLSKRALIPVGDGTFRFSTDIRLKNTVSMFYNERFMKSIMKKYPATCLVLIIFASQSIPILEYTKPYIKKMQEKNRKCVIKKVKGTHDVHSNNPEVVAPLISNFLTKVTSKL